MLTFQLEHMNPKHINTFLFLLLMIAGNVLSAQDSLFAYGRSRLSSRFAPKKLSNYKFKVSKQLYKELIQARGDSRMDVPEFVMNTGKQYIAWMNPIKKEIGLEEKAYDLCTQLGADSLNAMAALIAHEITHYYEKHDWSRHFASKNEDLDASDRIKSLDEGLKLEAQADYLGGILAISAGYNTYNIYDDFLKLAYKEYRFDNQIKGYPSLEERLKINENTAEELKKMHSVFQTANLLTLIEAHNIANQYFKHLLVDYQSYEVYNNAGLNACLAALKYFDPHEIPYVLPLELDMNSRLDQLATRLPDDAEAQRLSFLEDAERWFKNAMQLAPDQGTAYLNLSVVYILKNEWLDASFWATKAHGLAQKADNRKQIADAQIALGVIEGIQERKKEAETHFTLALAGNTYLAKANLDILKGEKNKRNLERREAKGIEMIEGLLLDDFLQNPDLEGLANLGNEVYCGKKMLGQSELFLHYANEGEEYILFHQTYPTYQGTTNWGIQLEASKENILNTYKSPTNILELTKGSCLVYKDKKILFILDDQDKLTQWVVFTAQLP